MRKATEIRNRKLEDEKANMHSKTTKVGEKMNFKSTAIENDYVEQFRKNVLKRQGMEDKKKKRAEERQAVNEFEFEKRAEKLQAVQQR